MSSEGQADPRLADTRIALDRPAPGPAVAPVPTGPGSTFGRYRDLVPAGSGGMASVYKAEDPTLGRPVALKLLRSPDPELAERLLLEARAQARIEHEHVCRIYEAGRHDGHPYIAMQFVEGSTLRDLASSLTLEQKLKVMKEVAEAVHAAHRVGLVHRDLKPSNVMVERTEDGGWFPYVMDFGLAREVQAPGLTMTGIVLGTADYMSPEQARGETRTLDRRSDVYGLGATLYHLLAGTPPFDGDSSLEVLVRVLTEAPVPLSVRAPGLPADVQTIVMKCLEKEPARRYDSARALADDLGRYLDGEPITARRSGVLDRLVRGARKNKAAVATAAVAFLVAATFAAVGLRARAGARAQAQFAAELARDLRDVDWMLRVAYMRPLHDVRPERQQVLERLRRIEARIAAEGAHARGPGEYALGRGHLALGDPQAARPHLERAWKSGYRTPDVAQALGLALGALYQRELESALAIGNRDMRAAKRGEIERAYRDPAVAYLRQGAASDTAAPEYVAGLLAFYERRYPEAVAKAEAALARLPWFYEAQLLMGDVGAVLSRERHETGDAAGSRQALEAAERSYRAAAEHARSDPAALLGLCQVGIQRMEATLFARGDLRPRYDAARHDCEQALVADPGLAEAHARFANIHRFWANHMLLDGEDPRGTLERAAAHARRAIERDPHNRRAHGNLGIVYRLRAQWEHEHGLPAEESLGRSVASLRRAVELSGGDAASLNDLANAYLTRALAAVAAGGDPRADIGAAVASYDEALRKVPDFGYAHANRGQAKLDLAQFQVGQGLDAEPALTEARRSLERAVALLPELEGTHTCLAAADLLAAEYSLKQGGDPGEALARAREGLAAAARINPKPGPDVSVLAGSVALAEASWRLRSGHSPVRALDQAEQRFRLAAERDPNRAEPWRRLAEAALVRAEWRRGRGMPFEAERRAGLRAAERALELDLRMAEALAAQRALSELLGVAGAPPGANVSVELGARPISEPPPP